MEKAYLTEPELAIKLGMSRWTVRTLRCQHGLPFIKIGVHVFYDFETVKAWFKSQETKCEAKAQDVQHHEGLPSLRKRDKYSMPKIAV